MNRTVRSRAAAAVALQTAAVLCLAVDWKYTSLALLIVSAGMIVAAWLAIDRRRTSR